jgi:LmbE family N-acetylglucosaminyl deacetylase
MHEIDGDGPLLAVSPHLDDAVMSVGAALSAVAETGRRVVVCTVFAGRPELPLSTPAVTFHDTCGLGDDAVEVRLAEDVAAVSAVGAEPLHLPYLDALYRRFGDDWLCTWLGAHLAPGLPAEPELAADLTDTVRGLLSSLRPAEVWTCTAIGGHVDHRLTVDAVTAACAAGHVELALWEDLPYAIGRPVVEAATAEGVRTHRRHLVRKLDGVAEYRSQLAMLFPALDWRSSILGHAMDRQGTHGVAELLWRGDTPAHSSGLGLSPSR